jgi:hypothetical protein
VAALPIAPPGPVLDLASGPSGAALLAAAAVPAAAGGLLAWEAFTTDARRVRPRLPAQWCLAAGEPAALLPADFTLLEQHDLPDSPGGPRRRIVARRDPA